MADQEAAAKRAAGLTKLFNTVIHGQRDLKSVADGNRFLEAFCSQEDVSRCVERIIASKAGLEAIGKAFRFSPDRTFLDGPAASVILHLSHPSAKQLYGGQFLHRILEQIVNPPTFWNTLVDAHHAGILSTKATHAFAWLLLEILQSRSEDVPDVHEVAEQVTKNESLIKSDSLDIRNIGHKIKHTVESASSDSADGAGGRHDNDFADFRKIKILPSADEFVSTTAPFYRRADAVQSIESEKRGPIHLDNQFRLLREDFLGELRNDFQIATGQKKGRRRTILENLQFVDIDCGPTSKRKPCSLKLRVRDDIPQLRNVKGVNNRKAHLSDRANKNLMKHQSFGCLISNGNIVAFASVERDEDLLAQQPAVVMLHIADVESLGKVLLVCKYKADLRFVQVDTAVFAYEPILKCLQSMTELPLQEQLVGLQPGICEQLSQARPLSIIDDIRINSQNDLQSILGASKSVRLDVAQAESLLAGLERKLSLIQGPPGEFVFV